MIRARFTEHVCTHCGAHYTAESVVVLARRRSTWMVMACCPRCQPPSLFIVPFPNAMLTANSDDSKFASDVNGGAEIYPGTFFSAPYSLPSTAATSSPHDTPRIAPSPSPSP